MFSILNSTTVSSPSIIVWLFHIIVVPFIVAPSFKISIQVPPSTLAYNVSLLFKVSLSSAVIFCDESFVIKSEFALLIIVVSPVSFENETLLTSVCITLVSIEIASDFIDSFFALSITFICKVYDSLSFSLSSSLTVTITILSALSISAWVTV